MNVNSTIFIQACNFFFAYLILRYFYFKPAANAIRKERSVTVDLQVSISTLQATIAAKQYEQKKSLRNQHILYEQHTPHAVQSTFYEPNMQALQPIVTIDASRIEQLQNDLVTQVISKVDHA